MTRIQRNFILIIAAIMVISACAVSKKFISLTASGMQKNYWLVGSWNQEDSKTIEEWKYIDKNTMTGRIYSAVKGDTFVVETYKMERKDKEVFFSMMSTDNSGSGLRMKLKEETPEKLVFESATEKYPKIISFTMSGSSKTTVFQGEDAVGDMIRREFHFTKSVPVAKK